VLGPEVIAGDRHGWRFVAGSRVEIDLEEATRLARAAIDRIAAALPAELRPAFLRRGHLAATR
jgi:hypothetical protein